MRSDEPAAASGRQSADGRLDFGVGVASVVLGGVLLAAIIPLTIGQLGSDKTILAMLGSVGLIVFGGLLAASARRTLTDAHAAGAAAPEGGGDADPPARVAALGTLAIVLIYAAALEWLGFVVASYLCMAALMGVLGVRSAFRLAILPALVSGAVYLGVDVALGSHLPEGKIPWRLPFVGSHASGEN